MSSCYSRILLKLSGEALAGDKEFGLDHTVVGSIADEIAALQAQGVQIAIVIGGGNILRGSEIDPAIINRPTADNMGMLATVINSLALKCHLERCGIPACVMTSFPMEKVAPYYTRDAAVELLQKNTVVIIAGGTGNPFFTTDTAAALRAAELGAQVLLKATNVDGVYSADPKKNPAATKFTQLSPDEAICKGLKIMDAAAFALCNENAIPIIVFKLIDKGNLQKIIAGEQVGTLVTKGV